LPHHFPGSRDKAATGELFFIDGDGGAGFGDFIGEGVVA
jgi:hypothetical protein